MAPHPVALGGPELRVAQGESAEGHIDDPVGRATRPVAHRPTDRHGSSDTPAATSTSDWSTARRSWGTGPAGPRPPPAAYLRRRLRLGSDAELNVAKLAEETGEAASAYLALMGQQRSEKFNGTTDERLAELGDEFGDVIATAVILAHAAGLDVAVTLRKRLTELEARATTWADTAGEG